MVALVNVALYFQRQFFREPQPATIEPVLSSFDRDEIDVSCVHDFVELGRREVIRRRTICSDSTQQNSGLDLIQSKCHESLPDRQS